MKLARIFRDMWIPRVGASAAAWKSRNLMARIVAAGTIPFGLLATVLGARSSDPTLLGIGFALLGASGVAVIVTLVSLCVYFKEATKTLGVKVGPRNDPPQDDVEYDKWCERNGIMPNASRG